MWILKRIEDGKYVAKPGHESSYTKHIRTARKFATREDAERDACENERAISVEHDID